MTKKMQSIRKEISYGIILLNKKHPPTSSKIYLINQLSGNHWTFCKGHQEPSDQSPLDTAFRECKEELGIEINPLSLLKLNGEDFTLGNEYQFTNSKRGTVDKKNVYWVAVLEDREVDGLEIRLQEEEVGEGGWFGVEEAKRRVTFESDRVLVGKIEEILKDSKL